MPTRSNSARSQARSGAPIPARLCLGDRKIVGFQKRSSKAIFESEFPKLVSKDVPTSSLPSMKGISSCA
jgi:hypothetical protein